MLQEKSKTRSIELNFDLWDRQLTALLSPANEWLYGGAAGSGKSHLERIASIVWCLEIPGLQYFLFRRSYSDLQKSYVEGPTGYNALLGDLIREGDVESVAKEIRFPNGSKIYLCHCQHEKDIFNFLSFEFHVLNIAEAGQFSEFMINFLRSRVRMSEEFIAKLPKKYQIPPNFWRSPLKPEYSFPRAIYTCNPVGIGKAFLKRGFVDGHRADEIWRASDDDGGMLRQFIPAKLADNPSLDPVSYSAQLQGIGSKGYVEALLDGRWDTTVGAFFQVDNAKHLIRPFIVPKHWPCFMAYDHGACGDGDPFSIGWYTIADGTTEVVSAKTGKVMPCQRGTMICYRRWNGRGLSKQTALQIADGIKAREREEILFRVAGGDIIEQRGHGESIFSLFSKEGIVFRMADRRRLNGWAQVDYRLQGRNDAPLSFWFEDCAEDLETIGNLQHDLTNPQDTAQGDDHDADRHRYACMTRPVAKDDPTPQPVDYRSPRQQATPKQLIEMISQTEKTTYVTRR